jgi:hypothetical protein
MRLFQPVGGFPDKHLIGIDDNGHSHNVNADGSAAPVEIVESPTNRALPVWTLSEVETLVRSGTWEEVQGNQNASESDSGAPANAPATQPAATPDRPAEPQPRGQKPPQGDKPADDQASGKVRPFPDK